jgi:ABC-2 type transport system permease protein
MTALLHAELIKLRTTRTFAALAGAAIVTSLLVAGLVSVLTEPTEESVLLDVFASDTSSLFILVLALVGITGEWRHRTITSSLLAAPDRLRFLAAKTLAFAAAGVVLSLLIAVAVMIVGFAILSVRGLPVPGAGELIGQAARNALVAALLGAFGVGVGALVRNQVVAVVGLLLLVFVVEPTLVALAPDVGRFGPTGALATAAADIPAEQVGMGDEIDLLSPALAAMALLGWIGAAYAAGAALLRRRDLN